MQIVLGLVLIVLAGAAAVAGLRQRLWWRVLRRANVTTPDQLIEAARTGRLDRRVRAVVGVAGGAEDRASIVNGEPCVWHRHTVRHRQVRYRTTSSGKSRRSTSTKKVANVASRETFTLVGPAGEINVLPENMRVHRPQRRATRILPGVASQPFPDPGDLMSSSIQNFYRHREWIIQAGTPLYVLGEISGRGGQVAVRRPAKGLHLISTLGAARLTRRAYLAMVSSLAAAAACLVAGVVVLIV